jgi:hypothetical protein
MPLIPERVLGARKLGGGQQLEIQWRGQRATTWEALSRMRRQHPLLVQAFEAGQQEPAQAAATEDTAEGTAQTQVEVAVQPGNEEPAQHSDAQLQMAELRLLVKQQAQQAEEQQAIIDKLRASPTHSPQPSAHVSPQRSPLQQPRSIAAAAAAATAAPEHAATAHSRFARKEPRAQDLREYDGASGAKLDEWLDELSLARMLYELNVRESQRFAVSRLRGAALQWWLALGSTAQERIGSMEELAAALRARFQPVTAARTAREQLDKLQQGSRSVNDYIADFQRLRTLLPHMAEDDALHAFERGLRREIAEKLRVQGVSTVQEAIAMAARVGGLMQSAPQSRHSLNQMDVDDGDGASLDDRIQRAVLNAMHARDRDSSGGSMGAKTQTHRGYTHERERNAGGAGRGGARGGSRGGRFAPRGPPVVPGVPEHVVRQRLDAQQCVRCGGQGHRSPACPNAISASGN